MIFIWLFLSTILPFSPHIMISWSQPSSFTEQIEKKRNDFHEKKICDTINSTEEDLQLGNHDNYRVYMCSINIRNRFFAMFSLTLFLSLLISIYSHASTTNYLGVWIHIIHLRVLFFFFLHFHVSYFTYDFWCMYRFDFCSYWLLIFIFIFVRFFLSFFFC